MILGDGRKARLLARMAERRLAAGQVQARR